MAWSIAFSSRIYILAHDLGGFLSLVKGDCPQIERKPNQGEPILWQQRKKPLNP